MILELTIIFATIIALVFISYKYFQNIKISLLVIFTFLSFPIVYICFLKTFYFYIPGETIGNISDWISFSGGYIGAIITILCIGVQLKHDSNNRKKEEIIRIKEKEKGAIEFFIIYFTEINNNLTNINNFFPNATMKGHNCNEFHFLKSNVPNEIYWTMYEKVSDTPLGPNLINALSKIQNMDNIISEILKKSSSSSNDNIFKIGNNFLFLKTHISNINVTNLFKFINLLDEHKTNFNDNNKFNDIYYYFKNLEILLEDKKNYNNNQITSLNSMQKYINNLINDLNCQSKKYL